MAAFEGRKVRRLGFMLCALDPNASNNYMCAFLFSYKMNNTEVRAKALRYRPANDQCTGGYYSLRSTCFWACTTVGIDVSTAVLPPMADE